MESSCIAKAFKYLLERDNVSLAYVSDQTGINVGSLSRLSTRDSNRVDLDTLEKIAAVFNEDVSIFCGYEKYISKPKLSAEEENMIIMMRKLNQTGRDYLISTAEICTDSKKFRK